MNALLDDLRECSHTIGYTPLFGEVPYEQGLQKFYIPKPITCVPQDTETDPVKFAQKYLAMSDGGRSSILTPGTMFDSYGNRRGRGGGWYDRFFSELPSSWVRIGVCTKKIFSTELLQVNSWDMPMHGLLIFDDEECDWTFLEAQKHG